MKTKLLKLMLVAIVIVTCILSVKSSVLFETNFQASEGWVNEGTAGSAGVLLNKTINYGGTDYVIYFNQVAISTTDNAGIACSTQGSANIQKNGKSDYMQVSTTSTNNGYILLPDFNSDIQVSFAHAVGTARRIAIETSIDGGATWQVATEDIAPLIETGTCQIFQSPTVFPQGTKVRITNHTNGGGLKIFWLKVESYEVAGDPIPPTIVSSIPSDEATGISPQINSIKVTFNKKIQKVYGDISISDGSGTITVDVDNCSVSDEELTIPVSGLEVARTYTVTIPAGALQNEAGTVTASPTTFSFQTKAVMSTEAEISSIFFGIRQIGTSLINSSEATIDVTLMNGTSLKTSSTVAAVTVPEISVSTDADITTLPSDFSVSQDIVVTAEDGTTTKTWTVNFIQSPITPASLPVSFKGTDTSSWKNVVETGYASNMVNNTSSQSVNSVNWYPAQMSQANQFITVHFAEAANLVSFRLRYGQPNRAYEFKVQQSTDGETWDDVVVYAYDRAFDNTADPNPDVPTTSATLGLRSYSLASASRYVRWLYTDRTATTMYVDDIKIENINDETGPVNTSSSHTASALTLVFDEAVKVSTHHSGITISGGSFTDYEFIENNIMCNRDGNVVLTLAGLSLIESYTLTIPAGTFKDLSGNELPATIIEFENGVGSKLSTLADYAKDGQTIIRQTAKTLQFENMTGEAELFTLTGQKAGISVNKQINVSSFSTGVYLVRYTTSQGILTATKVILK